MLVTIKECGKGVVKDLMPSELAPGQWSDGSNVRARNGFAKKRGGMATAYTTPAVIPYFMSTYLTNTSRFIVEAGLAKVYVDDGTTQSQITRYTDGGAISTITRVGTTATLTTTAAHGRTTGDTVTVFGAYPIGYNVTGTITVTGATTFTYTMLADPGASATTVGQYSYNVQSDFTTAIADKWTGGAFNGVLVLNSPTDGMYYWNGDVATRLHRMPNTVGLTFDAILFFKNYVIGLAPTVSGTKYPQLIMWGNAAEPGAVPTTWTAASNNDAGDTPQTAETGGALVDGSVFGDVAYLYDQDSRFGLRYIGGNDVFQVFRVPGSDGALARNCIANTPKGQVFLSNGDVRIHSGGDSVSILEGRNRDYFNADIDSTNAARAFLVVNAPFNEVWVCYPSYGQTTCDKAMVWNWDSDTWTPFTLPNVTHGTSGLIATGLSAGTWASDLESWESDATTWTQNEYSQNAQRLIVATSTPAIGLADTGTLDFGVSVSAFLEKRGIHLDDPESIKVPKAIRGQFDGIPGVVAAVYLGTAMTADGEPNYAAVATHTQGTTNWVNRFATGGRFMAVKWVFDAAQPLALRSYDLDYTTQGRY